MELKYNVTRNGSIPFDPTEIVIRVNDNVGDDEVSLTVRLTEYVNGGTTVQETTRNYPRSFKACITGFDTDTMTPEIDTTILNTILAGFNLSLQA